jgi:hypothetical protein
MTRGQVCSIPACPSWSSGVTLIVAAHIGAKVVVVDAVKSHPDLTLLVVLVGLEHDVEPPK